MTKIKICGLKRMEDILAVNEAKPDYCGFIIHFPKSHRNLTIEQVKALRKNLASDIKAVGVIVNQPVELAAGLITEGVVDIVQLHGDEDEAYIQKLRDLIDESADAHRNNQNGFTKQEQIWKAFKIKNQEDLSRAAASSADSIILDNGYGTGEVFDWSLLENNPIQRPFFLAGGLTPENIPEAINQMNPAGIDISSGVETEKVKDKEKIIAAVRAVRNESN